MFLISNGLYLILYRTHVKLKGVIGLPPIDYIRLVRLKSAAQYLKEGKNRVNEVCHLVGFSNHSYFARCFQKQFGVLPKDYMKDK